MNAAEHVLLNTETVADYVRSVTDFFPIGKVLRAKEIGDGNINYVFRVTDEDSGRSIIVKQADKLLRSSQRPLDTLHNKIEAEILALEKKYSPRFVPSIYHYDETMCAICMEDVFPRQNTRLAMIEGRIFPTFAGDITDFMSGTLLPTTDLVMNAQEKKSLMQRFTNPDLCEITERLVFTQPYEEEKCRDFVLPESLDFVSENVWKNEALIFEAAVLRNKFMNYSQALIHGDLHTGSIFGSDAGLMIIDPEFAFYGPIGYDAGNVLANLFFARIRQAFTRPHDRAFASWVCETITAVYDKFREKSTQKYSELVTLPMYKREFKDYYIGDIMSDTAGYAGTEIIRRVAGDAKVEELTGVKDANLRAEMEKKLLSAAIQLIMKRNEFKNGRQLAELV